MSSGDLGDRRNVLGGGGGIFVGRSALRPASSVGGFAAGHPCLRSVVEGWRRASGRFCAPSGRFIRAGVSAGDGLAHPLAPSGLKELEKAMRPGTARATVTESIMIARASRTAFTAAPGKKSCQANTTRP